MKRTTAILLAGVMLVCVAPALRATSADSIDLPTAGGIFNPKVVSIREARFKTVIQQRYDFSCGSAALATLLTYHYGAAVSEAQVFEAMYKAGDKEKIQREGFSLLDMKRFLTSIGVKADGFEMTMNQVVDVGVPIIALINLGGYRHFVVVKGVRGDEVVVGDPVQGVNIVRRSDFEAMWNGIAFVIRQDIDVARRNFNADHDWAVRTKAPFGTALRRDGLASFAMSLPGVNDF